MAAPPRFVVVVATACVSTRTLRTSSNVAPPSLVLPSTSLLAVGLALLLLPGPGPSARANHIDVPKFGAPIANVTFPVGREAALACVVEDLATFKVAWLRVDTQTILTIATHVITKNHRIGISHSDHRTWYLQIREVKESDRGWYMCQINTDPMKSQMGYLEVVVPPDILDYPTSTDMVVREGSNVTLRCAATGFPKPSIMWRREAGEPLTAPSGQEITSFEGPVLNITRVNRLHMGPYLCIASNGVPPTVSKRIMLIVHFPPMIWIQNQLVGAYEGQDMTIECHSEAYPKSINYWALEDGEIISQGDKYETILLDNSYKVHMKLTINSVSISDFGSYKCVSKNSLGDTDGTIKLYQISKPSTLLPSTTTSSEMLLTTEETEASNYVEMMATSPSRIFPATVTPVLGKNVPYEVVDLADPERITKESDMKLRGRPRDSRFNTARAAAPATAASSAQSTSASAATITKWCCVVQLLHLIVLQPRAPP